MRARGTLGASAVSALLVLVATSSAEAYCLTTTCDPTGDGEDACYWDANQCLAGGIPLFWSSDCVSFSVQEDASPLRGINYDEAFRIISSALKKWDTVDCGGTPPSLSFSPTEPVQCRRQEYNQSAPNANVWMFQDMDWPYEDAGWTLALTTVTFNVETGEIYDADVEINTHENEITTSSEDVAADLASIVAHEAGHVAGLSHSLDPTATMYSSYREGTTGLRSLSEDDEQAICAAYPPGREAECELEPRHGFSTECSQVDRGCGCTTPGRQTHWASWGAGLVLLGSLLTRLRRRRKSGR
jgi:hypothetical protein